MIIYNGEDFQSLCERLVTNDESISIINLACIQDSGHTINDAEAKQLAESLAANTYVTELYLNVIELSVRGAAFLMAFIRSSKSLEILSLQSCSHLDMEEYTNPPLVIDVLTRAALSNTTNNNLCVEFDSCQIARSTLLATVEASSSLSELYFATPCEMIVDGEDPTLEDISFSRTMECLHVTQDPFDTLNNRSLALFLLEISVHLPKLVTLGVIDLNDDIPLDELLTKSRTLEELQYTRTRQNNKDALTHRPLIDFLFRTDSLKRVYLNLPGISVQQKTQISLAFEANRSIVQVWQNPVICPNLEKYSLRNSNFRSNWGDLSVTILLELFPIAAAVGVRSAQGRSALFQRLPSLLCSLEQFRQ
mmetsp:Transcript_32841/g.37363  ORF Transcript_32841/g.37363 Transcript_32841/m.37363 type:complete len:364 (-) Transcript_32841:28-1119(-)